MVVLLPSGCAPGAPKLLVGAMGALPHGRRWRSEHRGRLADVSPSSLSRTYAAEPRRHQSVQLLEHTVLGCTSTLPVGDIGTRPLSFAPLMSPVTLRAVGPCA
jgi:hypothetical protein